MRWRHEPKLQPNSWTCGPTALYNALQSIGVACSVYGIANASECSKVDGVDLPGLKKAARAYGRRLTSVACVSHDYAKTLVRGNCPMLLCVDRDKTGPYIHWIAALHANARHVWIADSACPGPALSRLTWRQFLARAVTVLGPGEHSYSFNPLTKR